MLRHISLATLLTTAAVAQDGLIAHYTFDEGEGTVARDVSGNGHDGQVGGAVYVESPRGHALHFDGEDDYVDCGTDPALNIQGDLTLEAWVRPERVDERNRMIFGDAAGLTINRNWNWRIDRGQLRFEHADGDQHGVVLSDATGLADGNWHHIALICEYPRYLVYIDGERVQMGDLAMPIMPTQGGPRLIGGWFAGRFQGDIDEVWLWDRAIPDRVIVGHAQGAGADVPADLSLEPRLIYSQGRIVLDVLATGFAEPLEEVGVTLGRRRGAPKTATIVLEQTSPGSERWAAQAELPTQGIEPGDYLVWASGREQRSDRVVSTTTLVTYPDRPAWFKSRAGISRQVMPPFEPLEVLEADEEQALLKVWGRTYRIGPEVLISDIESRGEPLLAGPARVAATTADGEVQWGPTRLRIRDRSPAHVRLEQRCDAERLRLAATTDVEYDGFMKTEWSIRAREDTTLRSLSFELPLRAEHARYLYTWNKVRSGALTEDYASPFQPIGWLGDEERGLQWLCESAANWHVDEKDKAIQVLRRGDQVVLRLTLVDRPVELAAGEDLSYTFGLIATPVKPMVEDAWDYRIFRNPWYGFSLDIAEKEVEGRPALEHFRDKGGRAMLVLRMWDAFAYPLPLGHEDEFRAFVEYCHRYDIKVVPYVGGFLLSDECPEGRLFRHEMAKVPISPYPIDRVPGLDAQMTHIVCQRSSWQDFLVDGVARLIDEYGVDGVYLDSTTIAWACSSPYHGCRVEGLDGKLIPTYPVFDVRETLKRIYTVVKQRKPDGIVDLHVYDCMHGPAVGFATSYWNGEQLGRGPKVKVSGLPLDRFRTEFMGHNWGTPADLLYYVLGGYRACTAIALLHDVPVRPENLNDFDLCASLWDLREEFGVKEAEWLPYWGDEEYVACPGENCHVSLWKHPEGRVLAVVSNLGEEAADVEVAFDLQRLGLADGVAARDALTEETVPVEGGRLVLPIPGQDFCALWVESTPGP